MKKILSLFMTVIMVLSCMAIMSSCGSKKIVVAENGSAGEKVAQSDDEFKDYEYTAVKSQAKALMEVSSGTADVAVVDYVLSIGSIGEGTDYANLKVEGDGYAKESYGIAFRKNSDICAKVNEAIKELKESGELAKIAEKYKLQDLLTATDSFEPFKKSEKDSDWEYVKKNGELIIGITEFAPMNYKEGDELVGFETEFAKAVCNIIGITPKFQIIDWNSKEAELKGKTIDCIWNGMTINPDLQKNFNISIPYMNNKQVKVVKAD